MTAPKSRVRINLGNPAPAPAPAPDDRVSRVRINLTGKRN